MVKLATSLFNSFCSSVAKQVARFCCPFYRSFDQVFDFLIHLQMLNCCIERKRLSKIRTASLQFSNNVGGNTESRTENNISSTENLRKSNSEGQIVQMERVESQSSVSDDEDEFFEAVESQDNSEKQTVGNAESIQGESENESDRTLGVEKNTQRTDNDSNIDDNCAKNDSTTYRREGAKEPFGEVKLLVSGEPLFVPVTQVCCNRYGPHPSTSHLQHFLSYFFRIPDSKYVSSVQFRFLGNCPPTPPLSHHFAQSENYVLMLA